ncbi:MAG: uridine kinase [Myxococcales bacterium]|jgi:uridine kinase
MRPSLVVGIAGGTGSGKTTVAERIASAFTERDVVLLQHDSYYRPRPDLTSEQRDRLNFDHPDALDNALLVQHLDTLRRGRPIEVPIYDYVTHLRKADTRHVEPAPVVLVEGILVFVDAALRERFDVKLFVDTDADIRVLRRVRRDMEERGRTFEQVREQYYETVRPMHLQFVEPSKRWADVIIPEGGDNRVAIDLVLHRLSGHLSDRPPPR